MFSVFVDIHGSVESPGLAAIIVYPAVTGVLTGSVQNRFGRSSV